MAVPSGEMSALAEYIRDVLYKHWKKDRDSLEKKWEDNRNAFNAVAKGKWKVKEAEGWRSKTFIKLTKIKVLAAFAMVLDIELQNGKIPLDLEPSPWDRVNFEDMEEDQQQVIIDAIDDMKGLIDQQHLDCKSDRAFTKNILSGAEYGETYAKWHVHDVERKGYRQISTAPEGMSDQQGQYTRFERFSEIITAPAWDYVSVWSIFRDLESDDIQAGAGIIQKDLVCKYDLQQLKDKPYYINGAIDRAIEEAVEEGGHESASEDKSSLPPLLRDIKHRTKTIERLEFWGRVPKQVLQKFFEQINEKGNFLSDKYDPADHDGNEVEIMCVLADNEVIRFALNEERYRPFHRAEWEIKLDELGATGVADNNEDTQVILNGIIRGLEDNIKLSANVMGVIKPDMFKPGQEKAFYPGKWPEVDDSVDDVRKAFQQIIIQPVTKELFAFLPIIERFGDEQTMLPRIIQGQVAEKQKPDTLGEMQILQNNAGKYLGSVIKNYDEGLIEPMSQRFYDYNMEDPNITKGKGNFIAKAMGFSSFQDRVVRSEALKQTLSLILSDDTLKQRYKLEKIASEIIRTFDIDPDEFEKSEQELAEEAQAQMEMEAQQEARVRQLQNEQIQMQTKAKIAEEDAKHENKLEEEQLEHENAMDESAQDFREELVLQRMQPKVVNQ